MATEPDTSIVDLDRTDELPVLDVAAYEARLAGNDRSLSRTDTWTLTTNVEGILKRIAELEAEIVATHETNATLERQLCERGESIAALEKSLSDEKNTATHLSRQLAAKLMDCEKAVSIIEHRNATVEDLIRGGDELNQRLQQEISASTDLTARLAAAEKSLHETHTLVAQKDAELAQLRDERTMMVDQLDQARARAKNLSEQIFSRDNQILTLQADLAVHTEALAAIRRDVSRIGSRPDAEFDEVEHLLEPVGHEGPTLYLTGEVLTVGRTSDNDISIPSKLISRRHARLLVGPTGVIIEDANSMNGCYVNGEQVRKHLLHDGDTLDLGDMRYRLRIFAVHDAKRRDTKRLTNVARTVDSHRSEALSNGS